LTVKTLFGVDCAKVVELNATKDAKSANLLDLIKNPQLKRIFSLLGVG
jgi:hypothetical protein